MLDCGQINLWIQYWPESWQTFPVPHLFPFTSDKWEFSDLSWKAANLEGCISEFCAVLNYCWHLTENHSQNHIVKPCFHVNLCVLYHWYLHWVEFVKLEAEILYLKSWKKCWTKDVRVLLNHWSLNSGFNLLYLRKVMCYQYCILLWSSWSSHHRDSPGEIQGCDLQWTSMPPH